MMHSGQLSLSIGEVLKAEAVMVTVSFTMIDAQDTESGKVLMQRNERHVRQVFARLEGGAPLLSFEVASQAEIEQRLEEAFAVFM